MENHENTSVFHRFGPILQRILLFRNSFKAKTMLLDLISSLPGGTLIVGSSKAPSHLLVVQDGDLEGEVLLQVLDDHHLLSPLYWPLFRM